MWMYLTQTVHLKMVKMIKNNNNTKTQKLTKD